MFIYGQSTRFRGAKWLPLITWTYPDCLTPSLKFLSMKTSVMTFFSQKFSMTIFSLEMIRSSCWGWGIQAFYKASIDCLHLILNTTKLWTHLIRCPISSSPAFVTPSPLIPPLSSFPIYSLYSASALTSCSVMSMWNLVSWGKRHCSL